MISIVTRGSPELLPLYGGRTPVSCADTNRKAANWGGACRSTLRSNHDVRVAEVLRCTAAYVEGAAG
jgi:hypothetical protein